MKRRIAITLTILGFFSVVAGAQAAPSRGGENDALGWMVDQATEMVVRTLSGEGDAVLEIGRIVQDGRPLQLGDYLAASLPIRLAARPGHRITVYDDREEGDYLLSGRVFKIGDALQLFLSLTDGEGRVIGGRELRLPATAEVAAMLEPSAGSAGGDRYEPDSISSPQAVEAGTAVEDRTLDPGGDTDWFRFELPQGDDQSILTVLTAGSLDTYIEVYDESDPYTPLAENDDAEDSNARVSVSIEPGRSLLVAVRGYDSSETGAYQLISRLENLPDDPSEPDNSREQAGELSVGAPPLTRRIFPTGDQDWYRITVPASRGEGYYLDVETSGELDSYMEFFDGAGSLLSENDDGGGDSNARIFYGPVTAGEVYLVKVRQYDDNGIGEYEISASLSRPSLDQYEPDDQWESAREVLLPSSGETRQERSFSSPDDSDWILFRVPSPRTVTLATLGTADTLITLYDDQGELIEESDDDGEEYNGRIRRFLAPGVYRLEIRQYEEDALLGIDYQLLISTE